MNAAPPIQDGRQQAQKGSVFSAEVADNFNDGTGFEHAVYAVDVRTLADDGFEAWARSIGLGALVDYGAKVKADQIATDAKLAQKAKDKQDEAYRVVGSAGGNHNNSGGVSPKESIGNLHAALDAIGIAIDQANLSPKERLEFYDNLVGGIKEYKISQGDVMRMGRDAKLLNLIKAGYNSRDDFKNLSEALDVQDAYNYTLADLVESPGALRNDTFARSYYKDGLITHFPIEGGDWTKSLDDFLFVLPLASGARMLVGGSRALILGRGLSAGGREFAETVAARVRLGCKTLNSFAPSTPVRTLSGLVAVSALTIGTPVLAFDEKTQANGYYPITAVHRNIDPAITYLSLTDGKTGQAEAITTTPEHPFYVQSQVDSTARPKPLGHEELNSHWVGAGHLQIGDKIKQANGSMGTVANVATVQQTKEMFNLTVETAHTFYVGQDGWLVHNYTCDPFVDVNWKGFSSGQLRAHFDKHGSEFGSITQNQYLKNALGFAGDAERVGVEQTKVGNFFVRYDPYTRETLIGHVGDRQIRTYYIADARDTNPFQAAVDLAKKLGGK